MLDGSRGNLRHGLTLRDPVSGRRMEVKTTEAGMQMYTAFHWNEGMPAAMVRSGNMPPLRSSRRTFPTRPIIRISPSAVLRPGEVYRQRMEWHFA